MEIVKINYSDYGLEEVKAKQIKEQFQPMLKEMVELEEEFNEIVKLEINEETCKKAKTLRLKYVKVRTGTAEIHKAQKAFYLAGGRFVDGWKNAQKFASLEIEEKLSRIEDHFENLEQERISLLQLERANNLEKYEVEVIPGNLGEMPDEVWNHYLTGVKTNFKQAKEAAKKAEKERLESIRKDKIALLRQESLIPYNDFIKTNELTLNLKECSEDVFNKFLELLKIRKEEHLKEQEQIRKENEQLKKEALRKEKKRLAEEKKHKEQEKKQQKIYEANLEKERKEKERIKKELEEKRIAEEKIKKAEEVRIQEELKKGDSEKFQDLLNDLNTIKEKYSFESEEYKSDYEGLKTLIDEYLLGIK